MLLFTHVIYEHKSKLQHMIGTALKVKKGL